MDETVNYRTKKYLSIVYFSVAFIYLIDNLFQFHSFFVFTGKLRIPILMILYFFSSSKRNVLFFGVLLFSFISHLLFLENTQERLFYGFITYMIFRVLTIIIVYKSMKSKNFLSITIAMIPFLFLYLYVINLTHEILSQNFYLAILNGLFMSLFGGLAFSNYVFKDSNENSWLLISALLFAVQNFVFIIQKFYFKSSVFEPIGIIVFTVSLYAFYKFVILDEEMKNKRINERS